VKFKLLLVVILIGAFLVLSRSTLFKIRIIDCQLNHYPCPLSLEPVLLSFVGKNIFTFNSGAATRQLTNFDPTLTEINFKKRLPDRLMIDLRRRLPLAVIKSVKQANQEKVFYLDKTGFIYIPPQLLNQPLSEVWWPAELALIEGESVLSLDLAKLINTLGAYYVNFVHLTRLPEPVYLVKTTAGPEAVIPAQEDFAARVASLQFILSNIKMGEPVPEKIDLRFDKPILIY